MDYAPYPHVGAPSLKEREVMKVTPNRLPWAPITVIVLVAASVGAWAFWPTAEVTPVIPTGLPPATISVPFAGGLAFAGGIPTDSGIENIYIMQHHLYENTDNLTNHDNLQTYGGNEAVIEDTGLAAENVPYENYFDIVVAVKGHTDNMAYVNKENTYVRVVITGSFSDDENSLENSSRLHQFGIDAGVWVRVNHLFDNDGNGYKLAAGENISLTVYYYCYK